MNEEQTTKKEITKTTWVKKYKTLLLILLAIIVAGLIYIAVNTVDISGSKNGIAAKVNGETISQVEFDIHFKQDSQGIDPSDSDAMSRLKSQVMDELIGSKLLVQAASKSGIKAPVEDIDTQISLIEQQAGGREVFLARLSELETDEDKLRLDIANQIMIQEYLLENIDTDSINVTNEEISSLYEKASAVQDNMPPLSEVKEQIIEQIKFEKQQKLADELVKSLHDKADIKIY